MLARHMLETCADSGDYIRVIWSQAQSLCCQEKTHTLEGNTIFALVTPPCPEQRLQFIEYICTR